MIIMVKPFGIAILLRFTRAAGIHPFLNRDANLCDLRLQLQPHYGSVRPLVWNEGRPAAPPWASLNPRALAHRQAAAIHGGLRVCCLKGP